MTPRLKICSQCRVPKPFSAYHRRRHYTRCGYRAACKDCSRKHRRRAKRDPLKARVRAATRRAIARGELVRMPCEVCSSWPVDAHHPSYVGPRAHLDVVWLCVEHHAEVHAKRGWVKQMDMWSTRPRDVSMRGRFVDMFAVLQSAA